MRILYGKYPFSAEEDDEISFVVGERIEVIKDDQDFNDGWYFGENERGEQGLFPVNFTIDYSASSIKDWDVYHVCNWLENVSCARWTRTFQDNEISGDVLLDLGLAGLRELGIEPLSQRIDLYRKIMSLRQVSLDVQDNHSDYAADIFDDYQESILEESTSQETHTPNISFNSSELDSPSTLIAENFDSEVDLVYKDFTPILQDYQDRTSQDSYKDDQTLKNDEFDSGYNPREGLSSSMAKKWSQLTKEYGEKFKLKLDLDIPDTSHAEMEDTIYAKIDQKSWKKRYGALVGGILYIFKEDSKRSLVYKINLSQGYKVTPDSDNAKIQYSFKLIHPISDSVYLAASSQASMLNWINKLVKSGLEKRNPMILLPIKQAKEKPLPNVPSYGFS